MPIQVSPEVTSLGCIPVGYVYLVKLRITNISPYPEKLKISCTQPENEPNIIKHKYHPVSLAPGMSTAVQLELHASVEKTSKYELVIRQESEGKLIQNLTFFVVGSSQYRDISNKLSMVGKRPYESCVTITGKLASGEEASLGNKSQTFSTALITDDEMEEVATMPLVEYVFWDPHAQQLILDTELCRIYVESGSTLEQSIEITRSRR